MHWLAVTNNLTIFALIDLQSYVYVLYIVVCPFVLFHLAIVLSGLLRFTDSDYPFGIFKLFFRLSYSQLRSTFFPCMIYHVFFIMSSTIGASNGAGNANHSGVTEFILGFHVAQSFVLCFVDNYWSFLLYFFFLLYCLSIVLQLLINRLICSNLSQLNIREYRRDNPDRLTTQDTQD